MSTVASGLVEISLVLSFLKYV